MAKASRSPNWPYALVILAGAVVGAIMVAILYWAQVVFIPVALAIFLTFLLSPLVRALHRRGLGRIPSVALVVALAALVLGGVAWVVTRQLMALAGELPQYTDNIKGKIRSLRDAAQGSVTDRIERMVQEISGELKSKPVNKEAAPEAVPGEARIPAIERLPTVVVEPESQAWLSRLPEAISPVLGPFGAVGLAAVLTVFILLKREDLRNRFIRLVGRGRMTVTTKAVDEAGARISRYLLMQLIVNGTYGLGWGLGLFLIGVDYALLWGFLAAVLRYVPYIGAPIAALLPIALSLGQFQGWTQPLLVVGLLVLLELVSNNVMEPWLYSQSIGVSEVAMLIAAAFWAFLWGPIGLVLSGPLTVCLVVLGKYVPQLEFFDVLLGDEPALEPDVAYYQRLLATDQDEAAQIVQTYVKTSPPQEVYDALLVPALTYARRDLERDEVSERETQFIFQATREILEDLGESPTAANGESIAKASYNGGEASRATKAHLLACPARNESDEVALDIFHQLLDPAKWEVEVVSAKMLTAEMVSHAVEREPAVICIGSLPPGGLAHTRYLCKRLRMRFPTVKIVVGRWGLKGNLDEHREQLQAAGADQVETTLLETQRHLNAWLPVLSHHHSEVRSDRVVATQAEAV